MVAPSLASSIQIRPATPKGSEICGTIFYEAFTTINRSHNFQPELTALEEGAGIVGMLFSHPGFYFVVQAISYMLNHWTKLTLFLSQSGAPIDNNIVERALKKAILNRRNAMRRP